VSERSYLEEISIRNLGAIERSELELGPGFNVLTGETGAGKTMILTALNLVLGGKSDSSLVRHGAERLTVSAQFSIPQSQHTAFEDVGASIEDGSLIISRTVGSDGKSKAHCGGVAVPAGTLSELSAHLIEIHGQSANQQIVKSARQRELLDRFGGAGLSAAMNSYSEIFNRYNATKAKLQSLKNSASQRDREIGDLEEFITAWTNLKAVRGEHGATVDEINRLSSVEDLRSASVGAQAALDHEDSGALNGVIAAKKFLDAVKGKDSNLEAIGERIAESVYILQDASRDLASYITALEADPGRLNILQERRAQLTTFLKRWGSGIDPDEDLVLLATRFKSAKEIIADLRGGDERLGAVEKEISAIKKELLAAARALTQERCSAAQKLSVAVTAEISALAMPHTSFFVDVVTVDYQGSLKEADFTAAGCDEVVMSIRAQSDGPKVALGKGASGGEMSRIMLALEVVIAQGRPVGTYIFDEVDAGVGGKAAIEVGKRLHALAASSQVIVVTHLPQVAAWADTHFVVRKSSDGSVVASGVSRCEGEERIEEIARMLAGLEESISAREHAAELLALRG